MDRQRFVSQQGRTISAIFLNVRRKIREKLWEMDEDEQRVISQTICERIEEFDSILRNQAVRGHNDPVHRTSVVQNGSSMKQIFCRLERQALVLAHLADLAEQGPDVNPQEQSAIELMRL